MTVDKLLRSLVVLCFVAGTLYRLMPLALGDDAIAQFFITEDGYLMLTVARNIAIGNGISVAAGEVLTNGIQPLATFLYAIPYLLVGGDKLGGLVGVILISTAVSLAAA